jgi:hypothetical protein
MDVNVSNLILSSEGVLLFHYGNRSSLKALLLNLRMGLYEGVAQEVTP